MESHVELVVSDPDKHEEALYNPTCEDSPPIDDDDDDGGIVVVESPLPEII